MRQIFREALENPEATAPLEKMLCENQLRWLRKGQNFRAWVAALHYEAEPSMYVHANPDDRSGPVPSWLCWIALVMGEPQGIQLEIDMPALIPHLVHAHTLEPKTTAIPAAVALCGCPGAGTGSRDASCRRTVQPIFFGSTDRGI